MALDRAPDAPDSFPHESLRQESFQPESFHRDLDARRPTATWSDWSCTVRLVVTDARVLSPAVAMVKNRMAQVERAASRFIVDSDLNWANANSGRPVAVSALLIELVEAALDGARRSGGALDPTVGRHLAAIGYDRDILLVADRPGNDHPGNDHPGNDHPGNDHPRDHQAADHPRDHQAADHPRDHEAADHPAFERVPAGPSGRTWRNVIVDRDLGLLTVPRGTALDLGATAKAQTADWTARAVHRRFGAAVMVEIGGDLAVAGRLPAADGDSDWQITVAERVGGPGQQIGVRRGGVATSTTTVRTWRRGELRMHHIVDPRTSRPSDGPWRTVSVAAESALEANVCSTAAVVLGDRAPAWLESQGVAARLVDRDARVTTLGGWPAERTIDATESRPSFVHASRTSAGAR